jgi:O-antigen ligase
LASLYCLGVAVFHFLKTGNTSAFFYHQLSAPLAANAIYVSLYVTISILYIIDYYNKGILQMSKYLLSVVLAILVITLMLLSSKMIIVAGSALILYFLFSISAQRLKCIAVITTMFCLALLIFTTNPIKTRFKDWDAGKAVEVLNKKNFANYTFDDVDLRILLAKLGWELTTENKSWVYGNGGKAYHQPLNKKMLSYKLFAGNEVTQDTGYINYNMHNQYLENFMQYGLIGVFILIIILVKVFLTGVRSKSKILELIALLFSFSFLSESVLETQAGILLFTLIVFYEWKSTKLKTP